MKFLFLLACAIIGVAAAPIQPLDKWSDITEKVAQIRQLVVVAVTEIGTLAVNDNQAIGAQIVTILAQGSEKARAIFDELNVAIKEQTLTLAQAEAKLAELNQILANAQTDIAPLVQQLTASVGDRIRLILTTTYSQAQIIAAEIRALLSARNVQPLDKWSDITEKVAQIRQLVVVAVTEIGTLAVNDNQAIGAQIVTILAQGSEKARAIFDELNVAIKEQTLTLAQAEAKLAELNQILANAQTDIAPLVQQLTASVGDRIRLILTTTYSQAQIIAAEIRALLSARNVQPLDKWSDITEKVAQIRQLVVVAVTEIGTLAVNDNQAIGAQIVTILAQGSEKARAIFDELNVAIKEQTLTLAQAEAKLAELNQILANAQTDIAPLVQQLTASVGDRIRLILTTTYSQAQIIAAEIRALLSARNVQPLDKWSDITEKVAQIRQLVVVAVTEIGTLAVNDNQAIGAQIVTILAQGSEKARAIFDELNVAIKEQTLTLAQAEAKLAELNQILANAQTDIAPLVQQLTASVGDRIRLILTTTYSQAQIIAAEIRALLSARNVQPLDKWSDITEKVAQIRQLVVVAVTEIGTLAVNDNQAIGSIIVTILAQGSEKARAIFDELNVAIKEQTLTLAQAEAKLAELNQILANAQADIAPLVQQLTASVGDRIRLILTTTYSQAQIIAAEIRALLA